VQLAQLLSREGAVVRLIGWDSQRRSPKELAAFSSSIVPDPQFSTEAALENLDAVVMSGADLVVVSSAVSHQAAWVAQFRAKVSAAAGGHDSREQLPMSGPRIAWWLHEGAGSELPRDMLDGAAALLAQRGALDGVMFVSSTARSFWEREIRRAAGVELAELPLHQYVLRWGIPDWQQEALGGGGCRMEEGGNKGACAARAARGIAESDFVFLALASFQAIKGQAGMARAFAAARKRCGGGGSGGVVGVVGEQRRRLRFVMAGVGYGWTDPSFFPQADVAWVRTDPDFLLEGPTEHPTELLHAADAYVSNTLGGGESWGLSTLTAMAAGKPVLASAAGATTEQMKHGESALLHAVPAEGSGEPQDIEELATHMCAVFEDSKLRKRLGDAARAHVREELGQSHLESALAEALGPLLR